MNSLVRELNVSVEVNDETVDSRTYRVRQAMRLRTPRRLVIAVDLQYGQVHYN